MSPFGTKLTGSYERGADIPHLETIVTPGLSVAV